MSLFGALIKTAVNVACLPLAVAADVVTLGNLGEGKPFTQKAIEQIKEDADD